ncbi:LRRN4 C-terminal-like protein [Sphaeramia orbicularis]|uniref:Uncharacterized protein n=1 Tax=Sphaeramia orbicularis TaxID=375764 RepID=A0A672Z4D7_9TELE|nr:LRRN4 C-terminal-like protein [Sphaeramia orbicularis]
MTSLCRNPALLLLFLSTLSPFLHLLFSHANPTSPPVTRLRFIYVTRVASTDDYDEYEDNDNLQKVKASERPAFVHHEPQFCQYNPCVENQEPCSVLAKNTGCICPGSTGPNEPPHPPRIQELLPVRQGDDKGKVEVKWCAPSSVVSGYKVVVQGREGQALEFKDTSRHGVIGSLEVGTKVCVEAMNSAGHSTETEFSCTRYDPPKSSDHTLMLGVIGGGVALLLLLIIGAVISWKYHLCQKPKRDSSDGLGNPSYSTEGTL